MEQYRRRPMFPVVPQERHLFGSFPFETGTIIVLVSSFILSIRATTIAFFSPRSGGTAILSQLKGDTRERMSGQKSFF
jgi:hypothetical protein